LQASAEPGKSRPQTNAMAALLRRLAGRIALLVD